MTEAGGLYTAGEMRAVERRACELLGVDERELMERAGAAAFATLRERWPAARRVAIVCGAGNNGGDGYVVARAAGLAVDVLEIDAAKPRRGAAAAARAALVAAGLTPVGIAGTELAGADVVVDAIFGSGLARPPAGEAAAAIDAINAARLPVLALDLPSGLDADTGATPGAAVRATATACFIGGKRGLHTAAGPDHTGVVVMAPLAVPVAAFAAAPAAVRRLDFAACAARFAPRRRDSHKGAHGHLLVIGGDAGYVGAPALAALAALRAGAGLVTVATRAAHAATLAAQQPELMCVPAEDAAALAPLVARADAVVIGPGLGQGAWGRALLDAVLHAAAPRVLDADALNLLATTPRTGTGWILTPHPGEAARLLGTDTPGVQADRFAAVAALRARYGGTVVLKGAGTLVADEAGFALCAAGNPGMAVAGMGDVLAGVIGALLAQGFAPGEAARCGVALHAAAGDAAARAGGERGLVPSDLFPELRRLVNP